MIYIYFPVALPSSYYVSGFFYERFFGIALFYYFKISALVSDQHRHKRLSIVEISYEFLIIKLSLSISWHSKQIKLSSNPTVIGLIIVYL